MDVADVFGSNPPGVADLTPKAPYLSAARRRLFCLPGIELGGSVFTVMMMVMMMVMPSIFFVMAVPAAIARITPAAMLPRTVLMPSLLRSVEFGFLLFF